MHRIQWSYSGALPRLTILPTDIQRAKEEYLKVGKICPFICTEHRLEAQQAAVTLLNCQLVEMPTVLIDLISEYLINPH